MSQSLKFDDVDKVGKLIAPELVSATERLSELLALLYTRPDEDPSPGNPIAMTTEVLVLLWKLRWNVHLSPPPVTEET